MWRQASLQWAWVLSFSGFAVGSIDRYYRGATGPGWTLQACGLLAVLIVIGFLNLRRTDLRTTGLSLFYCSTVAAGAGILAFSPPSAFRIFGFIACVVLAGTAAMFQRAEPAPFEFNHVTPQINHVTPQISSGQPESLDSIDRR